MKDLFYKPIKIKHPEDDVLVTGCLHVNHRCDNWENPLWNQRGFKSVKDHEDSIIRNWNSLASENTIGFLLGDNVFGKDALAKIKELFRRLNFKTLYVCSGNHYAGFGQLMQEIEGNVYTFDNKEVILVPNYFEVIINGQLVCMSHCPILSWPGQGRGSYALFCHVHSNLIKSEVGRAYLNSGARSLEVSIDASRFPFTWGKIDCILRKRPIISFDHHCANS